MEPKTKQYLLVTVVGVTLFVALLRLSTVLAFAAELVDLVLPILAGGILALFINVPMSGLEKRLKRLFRKARKQPSDKAIHLISFSITLLGVVLVLVLALTLLIPELVQSFHSLYLQIEANIPRWTAYLSAQNADTGWLMSWLEGINWEQLLHKITAGIDTVLINAVSAVSATVNIAVTASFALIISIYMSLGSESLCRHARTLVCAYLKPNHAAGLLKFCRAFRQSFANFLTGQCSEAVILGVLMTLAFSVFRIPYGSLVGMLTAICAIIPYVGALISCVVSVFLVLLVDPVLAVRCLIVYLAVQFIEETIQIPEEHCTLVWVLSVAQDGTFGIAAFEDRNLLLTVKVVEDGGIVMRANIESVSGKTTTLLKGCRTLLRGDDLQQLGILINRRHDQHILIVFGSGTDQRNASDIDLLDDCLLVGTRCNGLLERIEVNDYQIDLRDLVLFHLLAILGIVPTGQNTTKHFGVQGFNTTTQNGGITGQTLDSGCLDTETFDKGEGPSRRVYFYAVGGQLADDRLQSILVKD